MNDVSLLAMDWLLNYERFNKGENLHPKEADRVLFFFGPVLPKNST